MPSSELNAGEQQTLYELLGGEPVLRAIIDSFVDRVFEDVMIGYLFQRASRERIKSKEFEFAARHLGAKVEYTGRPLREAHRRHAIMGGQFMRRLTILKETLDEFRVPDPVKQHWVDVTLSHRDQITGNSLDECRQSSAKPES